MADQFSEKFVANLKQVFTMFDRNLEGYISPEDLGTVMRASGLNPTEAELHKFISEVVPERGQVRIDFPEFLTFMGRSMNSIKESDEVREAFRIFDTEGTGYITAPELLHILRHLGEPLSDKEIHELMREAIDAVGVVDYEEFVNLIMPQ